MALIVKTNNPAQLLAKVKDLVAKGHIKTWDNTSSSDFTHSPEQWKYTAWMRGKVVGTDLVFNIVRPKNKKISKEIYGVYHGRFAETLLTHFDTDLTEIEITSLAKVGDLV